MLAFFFDNYKTLGSPGNGEEQNTRSLKGTQENDTSTDFNHKEHEAQLYLWQLPKITPSVPISAICREGGGV